MPRVLLLCEFPTLFGGERSLLAVLPGLMQAGFEVAVAAPPMGALADELACQGIEHHPLDRRGAGGEPVSLGEMRFQLDRLLAAVRPDLVHANSLSMGRIVGPVAAERSIPSIAHLRDIVGLSAAAVVDLNSNRRLLAVSDATRQFHVAQGIDSARTFVLYNGVDLERFRPSPPTGYLHRELGLPADVPLVGTIGQIIARKGLETWIAAARLVAIEQPDAHFLFVGARVSEKAETRELETHLHAVAARPPLAGRVHFLGMRADIARLLPELTLLAHAPRQEPLGRVLLEAAACGLPIVATQVGGTEEIFPPASGTALIIPSDDPAALALAILRLINELEMRRSYGAAAHARASAMFDASRAVGQLIEHYQAVLATESSGP